MRVAQNLELAARPDRLRDQFGTGSFESRLILRGHKLPIEPGAAQPETGGSKNRSFSRQLAGCYPL